MVSCRSQFLSGLKLTTVRLSPSGVRGVVVDLNSPSFCGSGGCSFVVLMRSGVEYRKVFEGLGGFEVDKTTTKGFYDIEEVSQQLQMKAKTRAVWAGSEYQSRLSNQAGLSPQQNSNACPDCMTIKVIRSNWVNVSSTDANGYTQARTPPLQRLTAVIVKSGGFPGPNFNFIDEQRAAALGIYNYHDPTQIYSRGSTLDILCLGSNIERQDSTPNCSKLLVGSVHDMLFEKQWSPPYLRQQSSDGSNVGWQVLEVCHGSRCAQVSTIDDRPTGFWR